ncbi:TRAP transporter small permease [Szabonella alba]|uniref:TRAP transporter small permease protein n=1 Tax=Szabonella alba TaxID=2804194 RepID=A0A8K0VA25_9RHOB|nr:TRAP transporter small permease [Szabonella alba]MBL4917166.1 TRAP transporter small permease [Szabonella alba]
MQDGLKVLARLFGVLARITLYISGTCLILMTAVVAAQVFMRYVIGSSIVWSEPLAVQFMGWFILLGAAVGTREGYHLSFDVLLMFLPQGVVRFLHSVSDLVVGAFGAGMFWFGLELARRTWSSKMPTLGLPDGTNFLPLVLGGLLVVLFSGERLLRRAAGMQTARFGEDMVED